MTPRLTLPPGRSVPRLMRTALLATLVGCAQDRPARDEGRVASESVAELQSMEAPQAVAPAPPPAPYGIAGSAGGAAAFSAKGAAADAAVVARRESDASQTSPNAASLSTTTQPGTATAPSMIIRTGHASVEVDSLETAIALVRQSVTRMGGWVANTALQTGEHQVRMATLELKLPAARFDEAVSALSPIGEVESVNVNAEDVGEEFVDLTARAANSRRLEQRLVELLATRTGKLDDVLAVERELARVREEIERMEGRLRFLRTRAAVSTLSVTLHEPMPIVAVRGHNPIGEAFREAWRNFVGFVAAFIASLGVLVPLGAIVAVAVLVGRRWWPRRAVVAEGAGD